MLPRSTVPTFIHVPIMRLSYPRNWSGTTLIAARSLESYTHAITKPRERR